MNENDFPIKVDEDFYMSVNYIVYDENDSENIMYDSVMRNQKLDKIELYMNGNLYGYTYYSNDSFKIGLGHWNNDNNYFFIGVMQSAGLKNLFFLKGFCYTTRVYQRYLTSDEIKLNYDMTLKYRDSFKDE